MDQYSFFKISMRSHKLKQYILSILILNFKNTKILKKFQELIFLGGFFFNELEYLFYETLKSFNRFLMNLILKSKYKKIKKQDSLQFFNHFIFKYIVVIEKLFETFLSAEKIYPSTFERITSFYKMNSGVSYKHQKLDNFRALFLFHSIVNRYLIVFLLFKKKFIFR
jgi:hypothetical protein